MAKITLSDVSALKKYHPGDRLLGRVSCCLTRDQYLKIRRAVCKYVGADVRLLIVDCTKVQVDWKHAAEQSISNLVSPQDFDVSPLDLGVLNLSASVVDLKPGDSVLCGIMGNAPQSIRNAFLSVVQEWAGPDVEVIVT